MVANAEEPNMSQTHSEFVAKNFVPWYRKIAYGMGGPPFQMTSNALAFFLNIFLLEVPKIPPVGLAVVLASSRIWDAISDPIVGYLLLMCETRFGKFKPLMMLGTPVLILSFCMIFYVPKFRHNNNIYIVGYYTIWNLFLQTGLTLYHVPYSSMCMALTADTEQRDKLNSIRMGFEIFGVLLGAGLFGMIALQNRLAKLDGTVNITNSMIEAEQHGYFVAALTLGGICLVCCLVVIIGTKEIDNVQIINHSYRQSLKSVMTFKPYLILMTTFMVTSLALQVIQTNLALYITHSIDLPSDVSLAVLVLMVSSLFLVPIGHLLLSRYGKRRVYLIGIASGSPFLILIAVLPEHNRTLLYITVVSVSLTVMVCFLLPWSMLPDVIDWFYIQNKERLEFIFYSIYVLFNKLIVGLSLGGNALALQIAGYKTDADKQGYSVNIMLRSVIVSSGFVCIITSSILLYNYPITSKKRKELTYQLQLIKSSSNEAAKPNSNDSSLPNNNVSINQNDSNAQLLS